MKGAVSSQQRQPLSLSKNMEERGGRSPYCGFRARKPAGFQPDPVRAAVAGEKTAPC